MLRTTAVVPTSYLVVIDWPGERFLHPCHVLSCLANLCQFGGLQCSAFGPMWWPASERQATLFPAASLLERTVGQFAEMI